MRSALDDAAFHRIAQALEQESMESNEEGVSLSAFYRDDKYNVSTFSDGSSYVVILDALGPRQDFYALLDPSGQPINTPEPYFDALDKYFGQGGQSQPMNEEALSLAEHARETYLPQVTQEYSDYSKEQSGLVPNARF